MGYESDCDYKEDHEDGDSVSCNCCVDSLARLIRANFRRGDVIGITFIEAGVASIAVGIFEKITYGTVVVNNLLLPNTTSYVPLCDVSSVEKGIVPAQAKNGPVSVALSRQG